MPNLTQEQALTVDRAVRQISDFLALDELLVAQLLGFEDEAIVEYLAGNRGIDGTNETMVDCAIELIEIYTLLETMFGDDDRTRRWLNGVNVTLKVRPVEMISTPHGLRELLEYLRSHAHS